MSRDLFESRVAALVDKLGEDIAALASDGDEYEDGIMQAALILLDQGEIEMIPQDDEDDDSGAMVGGYDDLDDDGWDETLDSFDPFSQEDEDEGDRLAELDKRP